MTCGVISCLVIFPVVGLVGIFHPLAVWAVIGLLGLAIADFYEELFNIIDYSQSIYC